MIGGLIKKLQGLWAVRSLLRNPLYQGVLSEIQATLSDETKGLGKYASREFKAEIAERALREVSEVLLSPNPVLANREKLAGYVLQLAKYQVLVLPSRTEPEEDVTGLRGQPGVTGELKAHIAAIAEKDKEIKELAWSLDNHTEQDIYEACLFRYWVAGFLANVFHKTRILLKDHHPDPEKDWYRPFVAAMCAWEEHNYRDELALPDVLAKQDSHGDLAALKYSTFMDIVMSGARYPNFEWEESFRRENV
ncbi:MAG TPA: hypothetical protein VFA81_02420 [Burkholderiales bacterium]|nr:hypothetical protein [Burkholderiales bacterium]